MRIRAGPDMDAHAQRRDDGRHAARGFARLRHDTVASEIHGVLHGPADTKGLHPRQRFGRGVVEMGDGPAQRRDRRLLVDLFIEVEELMDGFVFLPMDGDRQPLFCRPANDLEELCPSPPRRARCCCTWRR